MGQGTGQPIIEAVCNSANQFKINGVIYPWEEIRCSRSAKAISRFTGRTCNGGHEGEIGFSISNRLFIPQIVFCFDQINQDTLYTNYEVISAINGAYRSTERPFFEEDPGFHKIGSQTLQNLYNRNVQRATVNQLVGLPQGSTKYIQNGQDFCLSRGHMAARADFFYPPQMDATFRYINSAPQWQPFNGQNWEAVERSTRDYASRNNVNLQVWTGIYGTATLRHEVTGNDTELYLYIGNGNKKIRVPALYWKVVYNPSSKKGVVFLGINNPYEQHVGKHIICPDISDRINWVSWDKKSIPKGYTYACTIPEFKRAVSYAPDLTVDGLLV